MAKYVENSHFSFARIFNLVENMSLRSSPLHEAANLWWQPYDDTKKVKILKSIKLNYDITY